jgi:hypothetical protein
VLVVDAQRRAEHALVSPLPGQTPDGIALSPDDHFAYVDERVSGDIAVLELTRNKGGLSARVAGATIARFERDPMPGQLFGSKQQVTRLAECASLSATVRAGEPHTTSSASATNRRCPQSFTPSSISGRDPPPAPSPTPP